MLTHTALTKPNIAAAPAIASIASALATSAQLAARRLRQGGGSATKNAGADTGTGARASVTSGGVWATGNGSSRLSPLLAANASSVEIQTHEFWTSITSTTKRRTNQRTENTQCRYGSSCGNERLTTSKFSAPIATGSRRTPSTGAQDTSCKRIDGAHRQPRLFKDEPPKPKQEALL